MQDHQPGLKSDVCVIRCTCEECITMPTEEQNVCCKELNAVQNRCGELPEEPRCMTLHPGLEPVCLNPYSLQNALNVYQADHGPLDVKERAARARYLAYRSFVSWCWGYLGKNSRVVIPSCVVRRSHEEYPDEDGEYTGFKPPI
ncbi:P2X purinoceptor 7-like isoform X2 [Epinephelus fuscoguttatus]|uniref:P2X purinoceptor 7-like isoform X2 n=1 Tax=Epinephelus fuscoguttatus TaxID=293821 RepID=UPI0020D05968|nr:P2X purinoceptor 7-like isoform X2 [Epinephelus fuscoguttatus]